jgi:peptidoglycan/LPS O-acetylase OafA/YrhL
MRSIGKVGASRMTSLDLLRLMAALAVMLYHYLFRGAIAGNLDVSYPAAAPYAIYGNLGVNLFFLISGFVIAWSAEGRTWQEFAVARFARLYPGFLVCMTVTFIFLVVAKDQRLPADATTYVANLTMFARVFGRQSMDGVYWSIMVEILFYGWVAMLMLAGAFQRWKLPIVAVWLAISAVNEIWIGNPAMRIFFITDYAPFFAGGIVAEDMVARGRSPTALLLLAVALLLSYKTMVLPQTWMQEHYGVSLSRAGLIIANTAIYGVFAAAVFFGNVIKPSNYIAMIGGITYPLYLLHQYIGYISLNALAPHVGKNAAFFVVSGGVLFAAFLVCRFIETPVRKPLVRALISGVNRLSPTARQIAPNSHTLTS